jgi:hypothetical protein
MYYRIILFVVFSCFVIVACNDSADDSDTTFNPQPDLVYVQVPDSLLVWDVDPEAKTIKKYTEIPDSAITPKAVINGLNFKYPGIKLEFEKHGGDTLYTVIADNELLGERMGSAGASAYFADVVLNLTSIRGIRYVRVKMEPRSHASPGTWSRNNFPGYTELASTKPD